MEGIKYPIDHPTDPIDHLNPEFENELFNKIVYIKDLQIQRLESELEKIKLELSLEKAKSNINYQPWGSSWIMASGKTQPIVYHDKITDEPIILNDEYDKMFGSTTWEMDSNLLKESYKDTQFEFNKEVESIDYIYEDPINWKYDSNKNAFIAS